MDTNLVKFEGTVSRNPDVFNSDKTKTPFMTMSLEINEAGVVSSEPRKSFHRIKGFGKRLTDQAPKLMQGAKIKMFGRLATRSYDADGETKYITEVIIDPGNFIILKPCTEAADPMADFDQAASDEASLHSRVDQAVNVENRQDQDTVDPIDDDGVPF
jgi:single-stranded DNA-binding protein